MEISREEHASVKRVVKKRKRRSSTNDGGDPPKRWSDLPNDLLDSIKKRLFYIDKCNLSIVCKSWSCIEKQERNIIPPLQQMPWLLVFDETTESCSKLIDSNNKKTYTIDTKTIKEQMNISHFNLSTFHESKHGWLLLSCPTYNNIPSTKSFFMFSPFLNKNNNFIKLPILNVDKISLATFISNPLDDDDDFTVITLNTTLHKNAILVNTYRRGQDSWNSQVFKCKFALWDVKRWMYSERIFYYITRSGKVGMFDLTREDWNDFPAPPLKHRKSFGMFYMVKSNHKELLLIVEDKFIKVDLHTSKYWCYSRHHFFRLDLLSMIWEDSTSIGENRVLFVGDAYNCVLNSSVLKSNGVLLRKGISNTIYYCIGEEVTYVTFDEFPTERYFERQHCSRLYGRIARKECRKLLIDPPLIEPVTNDI